MHSKHRRLRMYGTVAALTLLGGAVGLPSAAAADPAPIGPHQYFLGEVNGASANAVIQVGCAGPVTPGQTGHPVSGQSVDVVPATSSTTGNVGYTGESADHVVVDFGGSVSGGTVSLTGYAVKVQIPTTLDLPCSGTGTVAFVPAPTSSTAHSATVDVTYQSIGV